jgi:hypothetical protein
LNVILQLPKLDRLSLCNLLTDDEMHPDDNSFSSLYDIDDWVYQMLYLDSRSDVLKGVGAVLHDFRTVKYATGDSRVDLRLAAAVMSGEAELCDQGYNRVSTEEDHPNQGKMSAAMRGLRSWWEQFA